MIRVFAIVGTVLVALLAVQSYRLTRATKANAVLTLERDTYQAQAALLDEARMRDERVAGELAAIRGDMAASSRKFSMKLDSLKLTREVPREGDTCTERDPAVYRGLFNEAVTGEAASPSDLF